MKNLKFRIGCLFMAFTVLFSSTGYGVFEHTCHVTHKKTISLEKLDACCELGSPAADEATSFSKSDCCSLTTALNKVEIKQTSFDSLSFNFTVELLIFQLPDFARPLLFSQPTPGQASLANAPPLSTKQLLALYQTYII